VPAAVARKRAELVVEQGLALVQQAADQRALAVVHAAAGDEAQPRPRLVPAQRGGDPGVGVARGHQK
jgi:hypothetical protein